MPLHDTRPIPTLPADHAFVVQLQKGTTLTPEALQGRVEHIVTGQEAGFTSVAELLAFIEKVLTEGGETA
jgi:hypothetical protein